jgi:hypothetical protein
LNFLCALRLCERPSFLGNGYDQEKAFSRKDRKGAKGIQNQNLYRPMACRTSGQAAVALAYTTTRTTGDAGGRPVRLSTSLSKAFDFEFPLRSSVLGDSYDQEKAFSRKDRKGNSKLKLHRAYCI